MAQGFGAAAQFLGTAVSDQQNNDVLNSMGTVQGSDYNAQNANTLGLSNQAANVRQNQFDSSGMASGANAQNAAMGLSGQLATGQGPSMSRSNMNLGLSQGANNLMAAQAGFGAQGGLGQRNMMNAMAGMQGQAAGQGALAGAQEQIGNIQNYGALGSQARAQGIQQGSAMADNAHANAALGLQGIQTAANLNQQVTNNNMAYDAANVAQGNNVAGMRNSQNNGIASAGTGLMNTAVKGVSAAATGGASLAAG